MKNSMAEKSSEVAKILKTLGHPKRLLMLCALNDGELAVGELEKLCETGQSQVSQFLKRMEGEGLVEHRKDGNFVYYKIKDERIQSLIKHLAQVFC
jgi:ArsR family transcriptional regulator, virulence genes transcriptional regulator